MVCRCASMLYGLSPLARGTLLWLILLWFGVRFIPAGAGNTFLQHGGAAGIPVYPRWRGEHVHCLCKSDKGNGLSPLARGTQSLALPTDGRNRFIPAGAGNTKVDCIKSPAVTVYPRWRGEHISATGSLSIAAGLSPLARGTRLPRRQRILELSGLSPLARGTRAGSVALSHY